MPYQGRFTRAPYLRHTAFCALLGGLAVCAHGQQFEPPAAPAAGNDEELRIVTDRPKLHFIKRGLHPLTWMDFTVRPILRLAEGQGAQLWQTGDEGAAKNAGVKFGIDRAGASSGIGPQVKLYHKNLFGTGIGIEAPLLMTYKRYESYGLVGRIPVLSNEDSAVSLEVSAGYRSRPADNFFGIGNDTNYAAQSRVRSVIREGGVAANVRINRAWTSTLQVKHINAGVTKPYSGLSAQDSFRDASVPGLAHGGSVISTSLAVERNTVDGVVPERGGIHRVEVGLREGDFSYWNYQYNGEQYFPLSEDGGKVVAIRGRVETNQEKGGGEVPFFDLPYVGGRSTIRGYDSFRFMDKSAISVSAEYRYRIWRNFDVGLFVDQGQVAPEIGDFTLGGFHTGYGARIVMRPSSRYAVSFDAGRSAEHWKFYIDLTSSF